MDRNAKFIFVVLIIILFCFLLACSAAAHKHEVEFFDKFCLEPISQSTYKTCKSAEIQIDDMSITIPSGFETYLIINNPKLIAPSILYDYLYSCDYGYSSEHLNDIFYEALIVNEIPYATAQIIYLTVRTFGAFHSRVEVNCTIAATFD